MAMSAGSVNDKNWKDLIRPNRPVVEHDRDAQRKAKLVIEPLERGFGTTLGNALRRVPTCCAALRLCRMCCTASAACRVRLVAFPSGEATGGRCCMAWVTDRLLAPSAL